MQRFLLGHLSRFPVSASLWTDLSPANVVVTAVMLITSHVIELVRRAGVLGLAMRNTGKPARPVSMRQDQGGVRRLIDVEG